MYIFMTRYVWTIAIIWTYRRLYGVKLAKGEAKSAHPGCQILYIILYQPRKN